MAYVSDLFDQLRDLLKDPTDTNVSFDTKKRYLNRGISRLWPRVYRTSTATITVVAGTYEYALPVAAADGLILSVEVETDYGYARFVEYDIIDGDEDTAGIFRLTIDPNYLGSGTSIRIKYVGPVSLITAASYAAAQAEQWVGPDRAMGLPVLYAMGMITGRKIDPRQDYSRYATTQDANGVSDNDIMQAAAFWLGQFEEELSDIERPLPVARD